MFNFRETVLFSSMFIFVTGASWALYRLADSLGFWPFITLGLVTLGLMVSAGYAYDHFERTRSQR